jgi:tetratricopeptide (TPR) repeat protein
MRRRFCRGRFSFALGVCAFAAICGAARAQQKYASFNDAMAAAARHARNGDYPAAVAPLEAALTLAKDDAERLKAYEALVPPYRLHPEIDKYLVSQEFVIRHTNARAGRSLAARDVVSIAYTRGKLDSLTQRYDAELKKNPNDPAALTILTALFTERKRDDPRGPELKRQLDYLDRDLAREHAERLEKDADAAPRTSGWHLKNAAAAWLEAGDKPKALAAAKKSAAGPPETRSGILAMQWNEGLGDVFVETGEAPLAIKHFESALASTDQPALKKRIEKKLAEARGVASQK